MAVLDNDDKKWLKENFLTKSDAKNFASKDDLKNGLKKIENKLDEHFKYLDKDVSFFRKQTAYHLGIPVSKLVRSS